jgi:hypothetical protein
VRQKLQAPDPTSSERRPILPSSSLHRPIGAGVIFLSSLVRVFCVSVSLYEKLKVSNSVCLFGYFANLTSIILLFFHIYIYMVFPCVVTPIRSSVLFNWRNLTKRTN